MADALEGRRVVVTGAATGIGAAAVSALTAAGAQVLATFHHSPPVEAGGEWVSCDVTDPESVAQLFATAENRWGGIDVLVHAAGAWKPGIPGQIDRADLDAVMATNFTSTVLTNQAAYRLMKSSGGGQIINFGSAEAVMGSPLAAGYAAAKAAVAAWTRSVARTWASDQVTANALAPAVDTPGAQRLREFLGPEAAPFLEQQLQQSIPLGGVLGDPLRDIGPVLVFLSSPAARFITGQLIAVDGGLVMLGT